MAELLTHVLLAYAVFTTASWASDWLNERWVAVGVVGSILPDLNRVRLLLPGSTITDITGVPFSWGAIHTLGGVLVVAGIGSLLFTRHQTQFRAGVLLLAGALTHILVDLPQPYADGQMLTNVYLFPFSSWRIETPGWYVSADRWTLILALVVALLVTLIDWGRTHYSDTRDSGYAE